MIEMIGLYKAYGGRAILSDAELTVRGGESVALVGANGSGKTTTLRCAVGLARLERGHITIGGVDVWARPREARSRISYLAQRTDFPATLTVREILAVVANLRGTPVASVDREISLCSLDRVADRTVASLSGGERQRVAMAALFIPDVAAYLLDEPTLNLDPIGTRTLIDRLRTLRGEGRAVLFTTHVNGDVEALATGVAVLREGRFVQFADDTRAGERHVSIVAGDYPELWVNAALRSGATRAWPRRGRLHAIVRDDALSTMLARLGDEGASVSAFRTETALSTALDGLNDDTYRADRAPVGRVDRCTAAGELWRHARWAGVDSVGPR